MLPTLMKKKWKPNITFPSGFDFETNRSSHDPEVTLAKASWVNFVQALGISPEDHQLYDLSVQSNLVNGIIPMRWGGKDLVGICTMLGFQSYEDKPSFKQPMPLPMQWSGPLGWLQFRSSPDGCVVEFRRRRDIEDQLSKRTHDFYNGKPLGDQPHCLSSRLWRSINGMPLPKGRALYLGGADRKHASGELDEKIGELGDLLAEVKKLNNKAKGDDQESEDDHEPEDDSLFDKLLESNAADEELVRKIQGTKSERQKAQAAHNDEGQLPEFLSKKTQKKHGRKEVLKPCPGLLSTVVEGELADSRGLKMTDCVEYHREYTEQADVDEKKYPYQLGDLCMDGELLLLVKRVMKVLKPDGYYFTATFSLTTDIDEVYQHVMDACDKLDRPKIFPSVQLGDCQDSSEKREQLRHAMDLCNEFQHIRKNNRATFTVRDMVVTSKASESLRNMIGDEWGLGWAMLVCPKLFSDLVKVFESPKVLDVLNITVSCKEQKLNCTDLIGAYGNYETTTQPVYEVPLCPNGQFGGIQVLAAFMDVLITFFWIEKRWISDVGLYDATIPQTITMC